METVSILLPAHNEGPRIYENLFRVCETSRNLLESEWKNVVDSFEVIVIDDGSDDNTFSEIERAKKELPEVKSLQLPNNSGKGIALRRGYELTTGSWIFFIDSDLDIKPEYMSEMSKQLVENNLDGVLGSKQLHKTKEHYSWHRRIVSFSYALLVKILIPLPVKDTQTGFKLFRREVLDTVFPRMLVRRYAHDIELLSIAHRLGFHFQPFPVEVDFTDKKGSVTVKNIYNMLIDTLSVFYRLEIIKYYDSWRPKDYSYQPMVSVVIAVKNDNPYLRQSVEETLKQTYPNFEIIVLPDAPIEGFDERVRIIPTGNELPAIKRNIGAKESLGEIIAFLDDDSYPVGRWLEELAANFADKEIGGVGGPAATPPEDTFWQKVSGAVYSSFAASGSYRYRYIYDRRREVDDYPTCNLAVRKSVFEDAKGFQTNYWPGEDTELCLTITKRLMEKIVYDPLVQVNHHRRSLWKGHFKQVTQYALHRGFFVKKFPETSRLPSYFIPTIFTFGAAIGWLTYFCCMPLFYLYIAVLILYFFFVLAGSFLSHPRLTVFTMLGTVLTHFAYGIYFFLGLMAPRLSKKEEKKGS